MPCSIWMNPLPYMNDWNCSAPTLGGLLLWPWSRVASGDLLQRPQRAVEQRREHQPDTRPKSTATATAHAHGGEAATPYLPLQALGGCALRTTGWISRPAGERASRILRWADAAAAVAALNAVPQRAAIVGSGSAKLSRYQDYGAARPRSSSMRVAARPRLLSGVGSLARTVSPTANESWSSGGLPAFPLPLVTRSLRTPQLRPRRSFRR